MRRPIAVLAAATFIALMAGCSSGSSKKDTASSGTTVAPAATTAPSYSGDSNSRFCQLGANLSQRLGNIGSSFSSSLAEAKASVSQIKSLVDQAQASTPGSVKSDVQTLATAFNQFVGQVQAANSLPEVSAALTKFGSNADVQKAVNDLQAYGQQVCGITATSTP
jgi:hypothetical protein